MVKEMDINNTERMVQFLPHVKVHLGLKGYILTQNYYCNLTV